MQRQTLFRLTVLVACVLGITALHYLTSIEMTQYHDIYRRLYYLPIVLGGLWFTLRGGVTTSLSVSFLYAPHVLLQWGHRITSYNVCYTKLLRVIPWYRCRIFRSCPRHHPRSC